MFGSRTRKTRPIHRLVEDLEEITLEVFSDKRLAVSVCFVLSRMFQVAPQLYELGLLRSSFLIMQAVRVGIRVRVILAAGVVNNMLSS